MLTVAAIAYILLVPGLVSYLGIYTWVPEDYPHLYAVIHTATVPAFWLAVNVPPLDAICVKIELFLVDVFGIPAAQSRDEP